VPAYVFRVQLLPNPPLEYDPDEPAWRDVVVDGTHTLVQFHETIFDAFERWDAHGYEFVTYDADGTAIRCYVDPVMYEPDAADSPMDDLAALAEQAGSEDARDRLADASPPPESSAADVTIAELDPESLAGLTYQFDFGDSWRHRIELRETREQSVDDPAVVDAFGPAPAQYSGDDDEA
jgi:hypothetical protein